MVHFFHYLLRPFNLLWRERIHWFWPIWIAITGAGVLLAIWVIPAPKKLPHSSSSAGAKSWSREATFAVIFLAVLLTCYIAGSLVWEDFTYYDNSHFTNGTLIGKNIVRQILPGNGRFFPLGHQEFNVIRHFTTSVIGYHALRIIQLILLCGMLLFFDEDVSLWGRVALIVLVLITPSILISFSGLIYPEWNVVFALICLAWSVKLFERTLSSGWAAAAVVSSQVMLYYKETAFLLLLGFAVGRILLRCWKTEQSVFDFGRVRDPESRLDICLACLGVLFLLYYLAAMFPNYRLDYADEFQLSVSQVLISYLKLDLLVWVLFAVLLGRIIQILRQKAAPILLWDGLALGGVACFIGYHILRMNAGYFLAPADIIAVLYLGHLTARSLKTMSRAQKLITVSLLVLVVLQDSSLSAFRMYERKNVIHAKAEMALAIKSHYETNPQTPTKLFFPFAPAFPVMEFASYLNYIGVPVEQTSAISADRSVMIAGKMFHTDGPCGYRAFICHAANRPDPGDLVVILPDDSTQTNEMRSYQKESGPLFSYHPRPLLPYWLFPYVGALHVISPIFYQSQLPDSWLNASVAVWQPAR